MLYYTAVLNGLAAPPLMILILLMANNPAVMGKYCNGRMGNVFGIAITAIMSICSIALLASIFM